jgi:hypothetical protein
MCLQDKHRLQDDQDRTLRFMNLIRQQIDSLTSSQMDSIMVDAMRQYNMTAKRMGLPDKTKEIDNLGREVQERFSEVSELQRLLSENADPSGLMQCEDEDDLLLELEALVVEEPSAPPPMLRQRVPHSNSVTEPQRAAQEPQELAIILEVEDEKQPLLA